MPITFYGVQGPWRHRNAFLLPSTHHLHQLSTLRYAANLITSKRCNHNDERGGSEFMTNNHRHSSDREFHDPTSISARKMMVTSSKNRSDKKRRDVNQRLASTNRIAAIATLDGNHYRNDSKNGDFMETNRESDERVAITSST